MKIRLSFLFIVVMFFQSFIVAQDFQLPTHADGSPMICEKFEMLEKTIPLIQSQINNNTLSNNFPANLQAQIRSDEDYQVGDSDETEFEIHAAINPTDPSNIIVGAMNFDNSSPIPTLSFSIYHTNDFGETWAKSPFDGTFSNDIVAGGGDPIIVFDENGKAYLSWILVTINSNTLLATWGMYFATSTNGGGNWTVDANGIEKHDFTDLATFSDLEHAVDKQWMVTDHSPTSNYPGNIYVTYVDIDLSAGGTYNMKLKRKLPSNNAFETDAVTVNTQNYPIAQFASIDVGTDGTVYVSFMADEGNDDYALFMAKSNDGGLSFQPEQKVADIAMPPLFSGTPSVDGVSENRLYPCPHLAVDKSEAETIYMTWTDVDAANPLTSGLNIYLAKSIDSGGTWTAPIQVNDDFDQSVHQFYSSIAIDDNGIVMISWYDQRETPGSNQTHYYLGYSLDGGTSFDQLNVTSEASDFGQISSSNNDIGPGEYNQIITTGVWAIPFWGDGRAGNGDIAVYSAFMNIQVLAVEQIKSLNTQYSFTGPSPNPVNGLATFELSLSKKSDVEVLLFDALGRRLKTIVQQDFSVGKHIVEFKTNDLPNGEYFVTINTDFGTQSKKVVVIK